MTQNDNDIAKTVYEQVCKANGEISDFRAKLLALLPIASGAGIFLLSNVKADNNPEYYFVPAGIFGSLVTLGLFLHELRGLQICYALGAQGKFMEDHILGGQGGRFSSDKDPIFKGFVSATWGTILIYSTLIAAWSYIGCMGLSSPYRRDIPIAISAIIFIGTTILGLMARNRFYENYNEILKSAIKSRCERGTIE